jgi:hypothetical protein
MHVRDTVVAASQSASSVRPEFHYPNKLYNKSASGKTRAKQVVDPSVGGVVQLVRVVELGSK